MNEIDILELELLNIRLAITHIEKALNNFLEIDGFNEEYKQLNDIIEKLEDKKLDLSIKLKDLKQEQYFKNHEEQWKKEKQQEENEYWQTQF